MDGRLICARNIRLRRQGLHFFRMRPINFRRLTLLGCSGERSSSIKYGAVSQISGCLGSVTTDAGLKRHGRIVITVYTPYGEIPSVTSLSRRSLRKGLYTNPRRAMFPEHKKPSESFRKQILERSRKTRQFFSFSRRVASNARIRTDG